MGLRQHHVLGIVLCVCLMLFSAVYSQEGELEVFRFEEEAKSNPARENLNKGKMALAESLYVPAIEYFTKYLSLVKYSEPDFAEGTVLLAKTYIKNNEPDKAMGVLEEHKKKSPGLNDVRLNAEINLARAQVYALKDDWENAKKTLLALTNDSIPADIRYDAIILYSDSCMKSQDWMILETKLEEYCSKTPKAETMFQIQFRLAEVYIARKFYDKAKIILNNFTSELDESDSLTMNLIRIRNMSLLNDYEGALALFRQIRNFCPNKPEERWWASTIALADALNNGKKYPEAVSLYELSKSLCVEKERKHALVCLTRIHIKSSSLLKAKENLAELEKLFPSSPELLELTDSLALFLHENGNNNSAAEYYAKLVEYSHTPAKMRYASCINRGECLFEAGEHNAAMNAFLEGEGLGTNDEERATARFRAAGVATESMRMEKAGKARQGKADGAIELFNSIAVKYPHSAMAPDARYQQATLLSEMERYAEAAKVFGLFASEYPENVKRNKALLQEGINMRKGAASPQEKKLAANFFNELSHGLNGKDEELSDISMIESFRASYEAGDFESAEKALDGVLAKPDSAMGKDALFMRSRLRFMVFKYDMARVDAELFFKEYPGDKLTDELWLLMGDSYANSGDMVKALEYYVKPVNTNRNTEVLPTALYESAMSCYKLKQYSNAIMYVNKLLSHISENKGGNYGTLLPRALYLKGDAYAEMRDFENARSAYSDSRTAAGNTLLGFSALGRQGDMLLEKAFAMGGLKDDKETKAVFEEADKCFQEILKNNPKDSPLVQMANYRLAFSLKKQGNPKALDAYLDIYLNYRDKLGAKTVMDDFYFANAVFDMAEILETLGDEDSMLKAISYYELLAKSNLPTSLSARERVKAYRERTSAELSKKKD